MVRPCLNRRVDDRRWADRDKIEGETLEELGTRLLYAQLRRLNSLKRSGVLDDIELRERSKLWDDDRRTDYNPVSHQIAHAIGSASDHLDTLRRLVPSGIPAMASFTLLRTAIEASCVAVWLMSGNAKRRVKRSLQLTVSDRSVNEQLASSLGTANPRGREHMRSRIEGLWQKERLGEGIDSLPTITDIILSAQRNISSTMPLDPIDAWRACSGIAHGNQSSSLHLLERRLVDHNERSGTYVVTTSIAVLAQFLGIALDCLASAASLRKIAAGAEYPSESAVHASGASRDSSAHENDQAHPPRR